jgi:hypothetical protein
VQIPIAQHAYRPQSRASLAGKGHPKLKSIQTQKAQLRGEIQWFVGCPYFLTGQQWWHIYQFSDFNSISIWILTFASLSNLYFFAIEPQINPD